jgi:WD40-like Beta Propeller Repeat
MIGMKAFVLGVVVAVMSVWASPAWGAFPGRDGDLVVATGSGLELVAPATGAARAICTSVVLCGHPAQPSLSPNGRAIAFVDTASHRPVVVAADGSCLWCLLGARLTSLTGSKPAFTPGDQGVTVARNGLWRISLGGGGARRLVKGRVDGAVWSSRGLVALVQGGGIWVGRPGRGKLRRLTRGRSPSFSPDGVRLAVARDGYVWIVRVGDGRQRRLVRGGAPAWSPNGRQIAYIAAGGAVAVIAAAGGRPHRVGSVRGTALDWQPVADSARPACEPPRGSTVLASNREAVVFSRGGLVFYGCLKSLGRTRLLLNGETGYAQLHDALIAVRLAGRFAAIASEDGKPPDLSDNATLYDLSSGKVTSLADFSVPGPGVEYGLDSLAVDSSGFAAWRETTTAQFPEPISAVSCPSPSLCIAGGRVGDILSATDPAGGKSAWSVTALSANFGPEIIDLSCPSTSLCFGLGSNYALLSSTDPTGGASAWTQAAIDPDNFLGALSCPSVLLCVATDVGDILTSTDPTGGASAWAKTSIGRDVVGYDISCPSVSLCVATVTQGNILSSTDPTGGATAWTKTQIDQGNVGAVSCPSVTLCVVAGGEGAMLTSTDPTGGANAWAQTPIDQGSSITAISCPSVSLCVAVDAQGSILTSTDPAGGAGAWSKASVDQGRLLSAISCPSVSLCVAGDQNGNVVSSIDPTGGANAWTIAAVGVPPCASQSSQCIADQLYVHDDQGTRAVDSAPLADSNLIGNVTLDGDSLVLSWTHDGAIQQLQLR